MKRKAVFLLCAFLLITEYFESTKTVEISVENNKLKCKDGNFDDVNIINVEIPSVVSYNKIDICTTTKSDDPVPTEEIYVKIRLCENCIQVNFGTLGAIIVGNVVATVLIGWAVYSISAQPKTRNYSGFKASDKQNLIPPSEGLYQGLNRNDTSEYSGLTHKR